MKCVWCVCVYYYYYYYYYIFNCKWVDTRWQQYGYIYTQTAHRIQRTKTYIAITKCEV